MPSASRQKQPRVQTILTLKDRERFAFLFEGFRGDPVNTRFLAACLLRCKVAGVPLDSLAGGLFGELVIASNPPPLIVLKQARDEMDIGFKRFEQARKHLGRAVFLLGSSQSYPEAMLEILSACRGVLIEARTHARGLVDTLCVFEARHGARKTGRPRQLRVDFAALGVARDDLRQLRRAVRVAARHSPVRYGEGMTLTRGRDDRCSLCGNPASRLFRGQI